MHFPASIIPHGSLRNNSDWPANVATTSRDHYGDVRDRNGFVPDRIPSGVGLVQECGSLASIDPQETKHTAPQSHGRLWQDSQDHMQCLPDSILHVFDIEA